ncbi:MAG: pitrilysin family protein, partial [Acidobacteria bacterium]|nr:pitrilysin family protein [Acidobacteriota bacterium]
MSSCGYEVMGLGLDGPVEEVERMIDWAAEMTFEPRFDPDRWQWQRQLARAELKAVEDEPEAIAGWAFLRQLYGEHPRGRPLAGTAETLARLSVADSRESHRRALAGGLVIALAGLVDEGRMSERLTRVFQAARRVRADPPLEPPTASGGGRRQRVDLPGEQAHLFLGQPTVSRAHPDLPALELSAVVLGAGAGLAGRIPDLLRERLGLAYTTTVETAGGASADRGRLTLYAATGVDRLEQAETAMRDELERFVVEGASAEELSMARSFLEGQELFRRETARQWADLLAEAEHTGLAVDSPTWAAQRWAGVTLDDLRAAAERWLDPADLQVTVGLPKPPSRHPGRSQSAPEPGTRSGGAS